ncbi:hypothetical protein OPQ81_003946 [Rhizoctonia solani]|nr:hypothetical protein OPQ81_003946 [Rhizoctonia solani]
MLAALETDHDSQDPSHLPMPITTTNEPKAQDMHGNLQEKLMQKFYQVIENSGTQMLMEVDDVISTDPAYASQSEEQDSEALFLSLVFVGAGGPGNSHTYHDLSGGLRTIATLNLPTPTEATQLKNDPNPLHIQPFPDSQRDAPPLPLDPNHGLTSWTFAASNTSGLFLGYPDGQDTQHSPSPILLDGILAPRAHSPTPLPGL